MARDKGIRYHNVDTTDCSELEKNMTGLLKAWRDIDIIVGCTSASECLSHLADIWLSHKQRYPIPSDYGGRIIDICESNSVPATDAIDSDVIASLNGAASAVLFSEHCLRLCVRPSRGRRSQALRHR